jgi:PAS domain S-box-containing protein
MTILKTSTRIMVAFGLAAISITLALGVLVYIQMRTIDATATRVTRDTMPSIYLSGQLQSITLLRYILLTDYVSQSNGEKRAQLVSQIDSADARINEVMKTYQSLIDVPEDTRLFERIKSARRPYDSCYLRVLHLSRDGQREQALSLIATELTPLRNAFLEAAGAEVIWNKADADDSATAITTAVSRTSTVFLGGLVLVLAIVSIVLVIRRQLQIERTLRDTEARFRQVFEYAPVGIYVAGRGEELIQVNAAFCQMVGFSESELLLKTWGELCHPADRGAVLLRKEKLWKEDLSTADEERRYIHRNGTVVWCKVRISFLRDGDGSPKYSVIHVEDITESRRALEALRESEVRFRTMADACPSMMWVTQASGEMEFVNKAYRDFFDLTCEEAQAGKWRSLIHPNDEEMNGATYARAIRERTAFSAEISVRRADGEWRIVGSRGEPRFSPGGEYMGHIGLSADITEREKAREMREFQHSLLRTIHEVALDGILVVNEKGNIVSHSKKFLDVWRIQAAAIERQSRPIDFNYGASEQPLMSALLKCVKYPEEFLTRVQNLYADHDASGLFEIELKDGRTLERFSASLRNDREQYLGRVWFFRDITERKRADLTLRKSQEFVQSTMDALSSNISVLDEAGTVVAVNLQWMEFGKANQNCGSGILDEASTGWGSYGIGANYLAVCDGATEPDAAEAARFADGIRSVLGGESKRYTQEYPCDSPEEKRWFVGSVTRFSFNGQPRIVVEHIDITRRKLASLDLQSSEEKFRQLAENIREVFWMMNATGSEILYVGPAYEQIWGRTCKSLYENPMDWMAAIHLDDREHAHETFMRQLQGESIDSEYRINTPEGQERWIRDRAFPVRDQDGQLIRIAGIAEEITERKRADQILRNSEEKFRELAENIQEVFWMMPPAADAILYLSPAYEQIWGRTCESVYQNPMAWAEAIHPDDQEKARALATKQLQGDPVENEYRILTPSGQEKWIRSRAFPIRNQDGELIRIVGTAEEITERKRIEEEMIQAREGADAANRAKSRFLANMSHEIRTPMNGVVGMNQLLLETDLTPEQRQYAEVAQESGRSLLSLIDDILDLSKIEAGKVTLENREFDLARTVQVALEILRAKANSKGIYIDSHVSHKIPSLLCGDAHRLRQVLTNLVANAIKFTEHGGITLTAELESRRGRTATVRFAIADTGIGINPNRIAALFSPFVQADTSTTRKYGGTGLGLTISKQLVEMMGGTIGANSQEDHGSTFWFTAVFEDLGSGGPQSGNNTRPTTVHAPHSPMRIGHGERVLVAEDNPTNRLVILAQLKKLGYKAEAVDNGALAVDAVLRGNYQLVMMDCEMPVMDGYEATRHIRLSVQSRIPIVALTANAMAADREKCLNAGMSDFLAKPLEIPRLAEVLARWLPDSGSDERVQDHKEGSSEPATFASDSLMLRLLGDRELACTVLKGFLQDTPVQFDKLLARLGAKDVPGFRLLAHSLKGAAATVGAVALDLVALSMEAAGDGRRLDRCHELLHDAREEFDRFKSTVERERWV